MRRTMLAVTLLAVAFAAGVSYAQEKGPTPMPEKVRVVLEKMVGTWHLEGDPTDGVSMTGKVVVQWTPGKQYLITNSEYQMGDINSYDNGLIGWDGRSKDGIVLFWMAPAGLHSLMRVKVVSDTVCEGVCTGASGGKRSKSKLRMVIQGSDKSTWYFTEQTLGSESDPDWKVVYTRAKTSSVDTQADSGV